MRCAKGQVDTWFLVQIQFNGGTIRKRKATTATTPRSRQHFLHISGLPFDTLCAHMCFWFLATLFLERNQLAAEEAECQAARL